MNRRYRIALLIGLLGIALALQGCSNNNDGEAGGDNAPAVNAGQTAAPPESPAELPAAEPAADDSDDETDDASGRLFAVRIAASSGITYGYVDEQGEVAIPGVYDNAYSFREGGWAEAYDGNELLLIDRAGEAWIRLSDGYVLGYNEGRVVATNGSRSMLIDPAKQIILVDTNDVLDVPSDGRVRFTEAAASGARLQGYLDLDGKVVIPAQYEAAESFNGGKAVVKTEDGAFLLIDKSGKTVTSFDTDLHEVTGYGDGMVIVRLRQGGPAGFAAEDGTMRIEPMYQYADSFQDQLAVVTVMDGGKLRSGVVDRQGAAVIPAEYDVIYRVGDGRFALGRADAEGAYSYRVADADGKLLNGVYHSVTDSNGHVYGFDGERTAFIGSDGTYDSKRPSFEGEAVLAVHRDTVEARAFGRLSIVGMDGGLIWKETRSVELSGGVRITEQLARDGARRYVYYPEIDGIADEAAERTRNERYRSEAEQLLAAYRPDDSNSTDDEYLANTSVSVDYEAAGPYGRVVVMKQEGYEYNQGAAHGMPWKTYEHIDLTTGAAYVLGDLLSEAGMTELERRIRQAVESDRDPDGFGYDLTHWEGVNGEHSFYVQDGELSVYFHPYEIAPYAAGFPEFRYPLAELEGWIDREGAFWQALNG